MAVEWFCRGALKGDASFMAGIGNSGYKKVLLLIPIANKEKGILCIRPPFLL